VREVLRSRRRGEAGVKVVWQGHPAALFVVGREAQSKIRTPARTDDRVAVTRLTRGGKGRPVWNGRSVCTEVCPTERGAES
jgi:hypothetical protein